MVGEVKEAETALSLRVCLENSQGGRVLVYDLEDVRKSVGISDDEKLTRYLKDSTGIVLFLSDALIGCIDNNRTMEVTINQSKFALNGDLVKKLMEDEKFRKKCIPLSRSNEKVLQALGSCDNSIDIPEGEIDDDRIRDIANKIRPMLEGFNSK